MVAVPGRAAMEMKQDLVRIRLYMGADKMHGGRPLHEAIVLKAREQHLAGATILRGTEGYGRSTRLHSVDVLFSEDTPVVIEIIDTAEKIDAFLPLLETIDDVVLVTCEKIRAMLRH
jgi:PII-like signaling protein